MSDDRTKDLILSILATKKGNREFILTFDGGEEWEAAIGNTSKHVALGEAITYGDNFAEFIAVGNGPFEALRNLLKGVQEGQRGQ